MPHSVFTGRPTPAPGEPLFLDEDTAGALALAEEERDTCPSCGMPKAWCRDPRNQFGVFEPTEEQCHVSYVLATRREAWGDRPDVQRAATQLSVRFADGKAPDYEAGLGLAEQEQGAEGQQYQQHDR